MVAMFDTTEKNGGWVFARDVTGRFVKTARNWTVLFGRLADAKSQA